MPAFSRRRLVLSVLALPSLGLPAFAQSVRLVALGGSITEIVYALGAEGMLVGVDSTSLFPPEALRDKSNVGYVRALSAEGIIALGPTRVLAIAGAGPADVLAQIEAAGVSLFRIPDRDNADGVVEKIRAVGAAIDKKDAADVLARDLAQRLDTLARARAALAEKRRVLFVLSLQNGRAMVAGRGTAADAIIDLAGAANAASGFTGYKPVDDEAIVAAAPDAILMMNNGGHTVSSDELFALPTFARVPAARTRALITMEGNYLLGFGPRTPDAARDLMARLYSPASAGPAR